MGIMSSMGSALFGNSGSERQETLSDEQIAARNAQAAAMAQAVQNSGQALAGYTANGYNPNQSQSLNNFAQNGTNVASAGIAGHAANAFNPYDQAQGRQQFSQMRGMINQDANKQANQLSGSNFGSRFGRGGQAALGSIRDAYAKNILGVDQAQLKAETDASQTGYGNQMQAMNAQTAANQNNFQNQMQAIGGVQGANQQQYQNQMAAMNAALGGNQGTFGNSGQIQQTQSPGIVQLATGIGGIIGAGRTAMGG